MNDTTAFTVIIISVAFLLFTTLALGEKFRQECRVEAMKALIDPSRIKEICQ